MRNLVRRYVTVEQRKAENQGVTEDDVNEIKQDISAFRFELIEILKNSGMNTSTAHSGMGHHHEGHHDFFGSTLSGIFSSTPRRLTQHSSTVSSSQGSINDGHGHHHHHHHHHRGLGRLHFKRTGSHKRRWGTLIEAAKTGKVSRLIGRSRSEDSVCSISGTDSNQSMENTSRDQDHPEPELHGLAHGLALLKKKRKKFSASRNTSPIVVPNSTISETISKKCMPPKN
ncbi:hypothetical protein D910_01224, partial [Dendroctonus ponderosae]